MPLDSHFRLWGPWLLGSTVLSMSTVETTLVKAGLYECRNEAGTMIYTDSPTQLERCQPVGSGGSDSSRLGVVGGQSTGLGPLNPPSSPPQPQTVAPSPPDVSSVPMPQTSLASPSPPSPCSPGINPLNPLSVPPCPSSDTAPPDTIVQPPVPVQP